MVPGAPPSDKMSVQKALGWGARDASGTAPFRLSTSIEGMNDLFNFARLPMTFIASSVTS